VGGSPGSSGAVGGFKLSTFEGNGTTDAEMRACARQGDFQTAPSVTVDDRAVHVHEVETALLEIVLPADSLFGLPGRDRGPVGRPRMGGVA
jgi:hypothetical protein